MNAKLYYGLILFGLGVAVYGHALGMHHNLLATMLGIFMICGSAALIESSTEKLVVANDHQE